MKNKLVRTLARHTLSLKSIAHPTDIAWAQHVLGKCSCMFSTCPQSRFWSDEKILSEVENKLDKNVNQNQDKNVNQNQAGVAASTPRYGPGGGTWI